jgi:1,4-dihydroxy-6-naphthoate synthase
MREDIDDRVVLRLGHSPDPDDVFMWWPLFEPAAVSSSRFVFEPVLIDIEAANQRAELGEDLLEITALSCGQYPRVADRYAITACGSSMGEGYGPKLIARQPTTPEALAAAGARVAIPGARTTAHLVVSLLLGPGSFEPIEVPFKDVPECVLSGQADAGVVIHEGQLTYAQEGLVLVRDLGEWWGLKTGLPLPLGVNAIRRDLEEIYGPGTLAEIAGLLEASLAYAQAHPEEAFTHAQAHAGELEPAVTREFVDLYVNSLTVDVGKRGLAAVEELLSEALRAGLVPSTGPVQPIRSKG